MEQIPTTSPETVVPVQPEPSQPQAATPVSVSPMTEVLATPSELPQPTKKSTVSPLMIIGSLLVICLIAAGAYYLGTMRSQTTQPVGKPAVMEETVPSTPQSDSNLEPTAIPATSPAASQDMTGWKQQTFQIKKESDFAGKETISLSISHPQDWTLETINQPASSDAIYKTCDEYILKDSLDHMLRISYSCSGWNGNYQARPADAVVIRSVNTGRPDLPAETIMRLWTDQKSYWFVSGDGKTDPSQYENALILTYDSEQGFIPLGVNLFNGKDEASLAIADKIVLSLTAKLEKVQ
jgi:hypothetical protein